MSELAIRTEGLSKAYRRAFWRPPRLPALEGLSLSIKRGVVFGFLGPNGAGKTTTIRCLMDLIRPTGGKAWVLDQPCGQVQVRGKIGYLPDAPAFSGYLTARQFLNLCSRLLKLPKAARQERIATVLAAVSMTQYADERLAGFSRGMTQRIGIAQALLNHPELLILDEPLVGLDPEGRKQLLQIVREQRERGVCVFFCSHVLSDVEKLCDSVGILCRGKLMCTGGLGELLAPRGTVVSIPVTETVLAQELMLQADEIHHQDGAGWRLEFRGEVKTQRLMERSFPGGVSVTPLRESLEDLFFRVVKQRDAELAAVGIVNSPPRPEGE